VSRPTRALILLAAFASCGALVGAASCGGSRASKGSASNAGDASPEGASTQEAIGASCTPSEESSPTFTGFSASSVMLDANNPACGSGSCLVNHFQGLTSCPYGQNAQGTPPAGEKACTVPGTGQPVTQAVQPWCADRQPSAAVYCSCRCANVDGQTDDGATYCDCPGSFTCTQLVSPLGPNDTSSGAYCVEDGTQYDPNVSCAVECDPTSGSCG
jgi:hypothetical protein